MSSGCEWASHDAFDKRYHDEEWGIPVHDDRKQFEYLMLEVMQCGLSWRLMLKKRKIFKHCFADFDYDIVATYSEANIEEAINIKGMIRSRKKIGAVIHNAKCFQKIRQEFGSFSDYLWRYSDGKTILYKGHEKGFVPAQNGLSEIISSDLKKRGFKYVGAITVYSHLQACGIINDHGENCPRYVLINRKYPTIILDRDHEK